MEDHHLANLTVVDLSSPFPKSTKSISSNGSSNGSVFCRICHEGEMGERLLAPCRCTGTVALIHQTCLEQWLTSSNSDQCEICKFAYKTTRQPRPCTEYIQDRSNQFNIRNLIADIICFFLLTPLLIVSTYLCALGANQYFVRERWEAIGLIVLSIFLLAVYFTWCHVTTRFHLSVWKTWQQTNQQVRLVEVDNNSNHTISPTQSAILSESQIQHVINSNMHFLQSVPITLATTHYHGNLIRQPSYFCDDDSTTTSDTRQMIV